MMIRRRILQALMAALGVILLVRFAAPGVIAGAEPFAVGGTVDILLDSEFRFLSALAGSSGIAYFWMIARVERHKALFIILAAGAFAGGLARLVSMAQYGMPADKAVIATVIELVVPVIAIPLMWSVAADHARGAPSDETASN